MKILIDIGHPAHVHFFKNYYRVMKMEGHEIMFTTKEKECAIDLLDHYELPYECIGKPFKGLLGKVAGLFIFGWKILKISKRFKADMFLSISSMYAAQVAWLLKKPHIVFDDTEHSKFEHMLYRPFSTAIVTPEVFEKEMGRKHLRYKGFHELAYLHPKYFKGDASFRTELGLASDEKFALIRFVSWNAGHDRNQTGITDMDKSALIHEIAKNMKVFISSEKELPEYLEKYRISIDPHEMHNVLSEATMYVGEGATMASEGAMLGTPSIYVNSLDAGTLKAQSNLGLLFSFRNFDGVIDQAKEIILSSQNPRHWSQKQNHLLKTHIDVTSYICDLTYYFYKSEGYSTSNLKPIL